MASTAYDFSLFEDRPRHTALKVVENIAPAKRKRLSATAAVSRFILGALALALFFSYTLYNQAQLSELEMRIGSTRIQYSDLNSEYVRLKAEVDGKVSLRNIEEAALSQNGMSKIESYQVEYINLAGEDKIEISPEATEKNGLLVAAKNKIDAILEYITAL